MTRSCYNFIKYTILLRSQMMSSAPTDYSALSKRKERLFLLRDSEIVPDILYNDRVKSKMPSVPLFYSDIIAGEILRNQRRLKDPFSIEVKGTLVEVLTMM